MPNSMVELRRDLAGQTFTVGRLYVNNQLIGRTLEYPWRNDASWDGGKNVKENFLHTSCIKAGEYDAHLRLDHFYNDEGTRVSTDWTDWRLELANGTRKQIQFHVGNNLIKGNDAISKGCILIGERIHLPREKEPYLESSRITVNRFISAILGHSARTPTEWAALMRGIKVTVCIKGLPIIY